MSFLSFISKKQKLSVFFVRRKYPCLSFTYINNLLDLTQVNYLSKQSKRLYFILARLHNVKDQGTRPRSRVKQHPLNLLYQQI
jgi:hypothetical protein